MKEELLGKEVLAMYDIRGIQGYIFKTNAVKEIIGATKLVDDIIINGLKDYVKNCVSPEEKDLYLVEWNNGDTADAFIKDGSKVLMQVMFVGGGNAYVLFRNGSICSEVNRYLGKYVLDKTYSRLRLLKKQLLIQMTIEESIWKCVELKRICHCQSQLVPSHLRQPIQLRACQLRVVI